jgi:RecA-family ATPase
MIPTIPPSSRFPSSKNPLSSAFGTRVNIVPAATVPAEPVHWIWRGWLAAGKLHILAGQAGAGKTGCSIFMAATISRGGCWPDGTVAPSGNVVIWSSEDGLADTIIPRLMAAGANMTRVHVLTGTEENGRQRTFNPETDLERLMQAVMSIGNVNLIIIDPILQVVAGDSLKNAEVRRALAPLVAFAEEHGIAILGITHVNKRSKGKDPIDQNGGR